MSRYELNDLTLFAIKGAKNSIHTEINEMSDNIGKMLVSSKEDVILALAIITKTYYLYYGFILLRNVQLMLESNKWDWEFGLSDDKNIYVDIPGSSFRLKYNGN